MRGKGDISAVFLSILWPGLGQLAQGRVGKGLLFVCWSAFGVALVTLDSLPVGFRIAIAVEVAMVAFWAVVDAYRLEVSAPPAVTR